MSAVLHVHSAGPAVTVQDLGRTGYIARGLTRGGALDRLALYEGAALLGRSPGAAIEMVGLGGTFSVDQDVRIALTGARMQVTLDGATLHWNASHLLPAGAQLAIGGVVDGAVGYLHIGIGFDLPLVMGAQSAHLGAGLGAILSAGDHLPLHDDPETRVGMMLTPEPRSKGGAVHLVRSHQSYLFGEDMLARFAATRFTKDARANRQGIRFEPEGEGFAAEGGLKVVSEIISPGDIQITGDGAPYVLMCDSQTTGGYPRLGTVIPSDLPKVAQAPTGAEITMVLLDREDAIAMERKARARLRDLPKACMPMVRDPAEMADLLSYHLISGAVNATDNPFEGA